MLATLVGSPCAFGDHYMGSITEIVTATNDPQFNAGQIFVGFYQYESPTADGIFCASESYFFEQNGDPLAIVSLQGLLFSFANESSILGLPTNYLPINVAFTHNSQTFIKVSGNIVTDFKRTTQSGSYDANFGFSDFVSQTDERFLSGELYVTSGVMRFGTPIPVNEYQDATLWLLIGGITTLLLFARIVSRAGGVTSS